jgi:two-component system cell cycle sensor histidine kinase/response regulator CckA
MQPDSTSQVSIEARNLNRCPQRLCSAQVEYLYSHMLPGIYAGSIAAAVLTVALWDAVSHDRLILWLGCFLAVQVVRGVSYSTFHRASSRDWNWRLWFVVGASATAVLWGAVPLLLFPVGRPFHKLFTAVFLCGVAAFDAIAYSPRRECYIPSILLVLVPVAGRFFYEGTEGAITVAVATVVFAAAVLVLAKASHQWFSDTLRLRFEKDDLVGALQRAYDELEVRIEERTLALSRANNLLRQEIVERKRMEEALRESEDKYRILVNRAGEGIFMAQDGKPVFVNPACSDLTGYSEEELLSRPFVELIHPDDRERLWENNAKRLKGERVPDSYSFKVLTKEGAVKWMRLNAVLASWAGKAAVLGMVTDISEQKRVEEELNQREKFLSKIFASIQDGISVVDKDLTIIRVNRTMERWYSKAAPLVGKKCFEVYRESSGPCEVCPTLDALRTGQPASRVIAKREPDGAIKGWLDLYSFPFKDEVTGKVEGVIEYIRDITERKESEDNLQFEHERFQMLAHNAPFGMLVLSEQGNLEYLNPKFVELFGYERHEILNSRRWLKLAYPDDAYRREVISAWIHDLRDAKPGEMRPRRFNVTCKNGSEKIIHFRTVKLSRDKYVMTCEDVTERTKTLEALRESERKYRTIIDTIADGYHETDLSGKMTLFNDSLCEILGYSREELQGMGYREFMDELNAQKVYEAYNEVYRTGKANPGFHYEIIRKDGTRRHCVVSVTLIRDSNGQAIGFRGIFRDVTERIQLEDQLRQAAKMEAIGQLAGGIAHDFNNILTAIIGYSDVLARQLGENSGHSEKALHINRAALRAANLTRQLLAFSRKQILDLRPVNLNETLTNFEKMLRPLIGENIELVIALDPNAAKTMSDPGQIEQILFNLAINARDAMPAGGRLTIETRNVFLDEEYARAHTEVHPGPYVMFAVSDTGNGMDSYVLSRIFEPFFTTKEKEKGTGLGLSTVYGIVKQHRGHINAYSEVGRGTTFKVYLPMIEDASDREFKAGGDRTEPRGTETILVVEDEEIVRELTSEVLQTLGYKVLQAANPTEAARVSKLHGGPIHLMVTDVVLPQMDGKRLYALLSPLFPGMKALFVSGYAENAIVHHGVLDTGVNFLHKPFTVEALTRTVRKILDGD